MFERLRQTGVISRLARSWTACLRRAHSQVRTRHEREHLFIGAFGHLKVHDQGRATDLFTLPEEQRRCLGLLSCHEARLVVAG